MYVHTNFCSLGPAKGDSEPDHRSDVKGQFSPLLVGFQPSVEDMEACEEDEDEIEAHRVREDADEDTQEEDEVGV